MIYKKTLPISTLIGTAIWISVNMAGLSTFCGSASLSTCRDVFSSLLFAGTIVIPAFFFSLVTYFLPETTYRAWARFSLVWIPLSVIVVLISSDRLNFFFPSMQEMLGLVMWSLYVLISAGIIVTKSLRR